MEIQKLNREEFNNKYKAWAEEGFEDQLLMIDDDEIIDFLDRVFEDFTRIPDFRFSQIKVKFGTCRFYSNLGATLSLYVEKVINGYLKNG